MGYPASTHPGKPAFMSLTLGKPRKAKNLAILALSPQVLPEQ